MNNISINNQQISKIKFKRRLSNTVQVLALPIFYIFITSFVVLDVFRVYSVTTKVEIWIMLIGFCLLTNLVLDKLISGPMTLFPRSIEVDGTKFTISNILFGHKTIDLSNLKKVKFRKFIFLPFAFKMKLISNDSVIRWIDLSCISNPDRQSLMNILEPYLKPYISTPDEAGYIVWKNWRRDFMKEIESGISMTDNRTLNIGDLANASLEQISESEQNKGNNTEANQNINGKKTFLSIETMPNASIMQRVMANKAFFSIMLSIAYILSLFLFWNISIEFKLHLSLESLLIYALLFLTVVFVVVIFILLTYIKMIKSKIPPHN